MLKTIVATFQTVMGSSQSQQSAIDTIHQWRSKPSHELIFDSGRREITQYMQAVDRLQQSKGFNEQISIAMDRLRREFVAVLSRQVDYTAGPGSTIDWSSFTDSTGYAFRYEEFVISDPPSNDIITYLRNIAERMNSSGKLGECIKVYKSVRKSFLHSQLRRLRFEELSLGCNNTKRYTWDELKLKMELWIQVSKICVKILFEREKQLCCQIFQDLGNGVAKDECFVGTVQDFAVGLFGFAEAMSLSNQSYEKMESVLALYDAFIWVLPSAEALFLSEPGQRIRNICAETLSRIENEVVRMLYDFENDVLNEISTSSDDRGAIHQLTEHVMDQVNLIVRNKKLLTSLIKSTPSLNFGNLIVPQEALGDVYNRSFLELHLILIIVVLQMNLDIKSKSYQSSSLGHLFMMNNVRYIVQKIEWSSELQEMIGDSYMMKLNDNINSARTSYEISICNKFLDCFEDKGLYITFCFKSRPSRTALRKRIKAFNAAFEEVQSFNSNWTITDFQLRNEVRVSMSEKLVSAYENFLGKFWNNPKTNLILEKNIKYSAQDLEALVLEKMFADTEDVV